MSDATDDLDFQGIGKLAEALMRKPRKHLGKVTEKQFKMYADYKEVASTCVYCHHSSLTDDATACIHYRLRKPMEVSDEGVCRLFKQREF